MNILKKPLIVLTGPTAVGKTKLSIALAKAVDGEIISADSMQVYKYMDIGSAKITKEEMEGVPHHLIDVLDPGEDFHVVRFQEMAKQAMEEIYAKGKIPILAGGTGFYIQAVVKDIDFSENTEKSPVREALEKLAEENGSEFLHERLREIDPPSADKIHANNVKRVIRALEYYQMTGERISDHNAREAEKESPYNTAYFVLNDVRERLYARIDSRVDEMLKQGLLEEVQKLADMGYTKDMVSMQGLGYKEILSYLDHTCTLEEAVYILKRDTRHFAKRQLTWFKREKDVIWVNKNEFAYKDKETLDYILKNCEKRGIIPCRK